MITIQTLVNASLENAWNAFTLPNGVLVTESFDPENENPLDMQQMGWQMILDRYKTVAECWK